MIIRSLLIVPRIVVAVGCVAVIVVTALPLWWLKERGDR